MRRLLEGDDGGAGVREPRRPAPASRAGRAERDWSVPGHPSALVRCVPKNARIRSHASVAAASR